MDPVRRAGKSLTNATLVYYVMAVDPPCLSRFLGGVSISQEIGGILRWVFFYTRSERHHKKKLKGTP